MRRQSIRRVKLIVAPNGLFRKHTAGQPIPTGWIIIKDQSVFYHTELLDIFKSVPHLRESDYTPKGGNGG